MTTNRLEAFSDGVIAIIVTIMVLEMKAPKDTTPASLLKVAPVFLAYGLSYLVCVIMWVNHHHLMHLAQHTEARLMWANNNLLFWMSMIPFVTAYLGEHPGAPLPVAAYGTVLALSGSAFTLLRWVVNQQHNDNKEFAAYNHRLLMKSLRSAAAYWCSVPLAFVTIYASYLIFAAIPAIYFLPERRLERSAGAAD